jgi:anti-sigma factor RsiW
MNHEDFKKNLFALYDKELPDSECREVLAHMEDCLECRQAYTNWKTVAKKFFGSVHPQTSELFVQGVMGRLKTPTRTGRAKRRPIVIRWLVPALGFGVAALLFFISLPPQEPLISTESLLLASGPEGTPPEWISLIETSQSEALLPIVMEGP